MNLKKSELTFTESMNFINSVVDSCFTQDEKGNDIDYSSACKLPLIQATFCEYYTDIEFLSTEDEEGKTIEGAFEKNFSAYMNVDTEGFLYNSNGNSISINVLQYKGILSAIDDQIEFRKQKMIHSQKSDTSVSDFVNELLRLQIENQKLQNKILQQTENINSQFTPEEIKKINENIGLLNQNIASADFQKGLVEAIDTVKPFKRPEDHKRANKKESGDK